MRIPSKYDKQTDNSIAGEETVVDKFYGALPKMLHSIPEANIWECNPEYMQVIDDYMNLLLNEDNFSQELYKEIEDFVELIGNGGAGASTEDAALYTCMDTKYGPYSLPG